MTNLIDHVSAFKDEMMKLGYVEGEVDAFVSNFAEGERIDDISEKNQSEFMEKLDNYLVFARKCKKVIK